MYASGSSNSSAVGWKTMASGTVLSTLLCCLREFSMAWETREGKRGSVVGTSWGLPVGNLKNRKRGARARYEAGRPENLREKRPKKKTIPNPSRDGVRTRFRNRKPGTRAGQRPRHEKKKIVPYVVPQRTQRGNGPKAGKGFFASYPSEVDIVGVVVQALGGLPPSLGPGDRGLLYIGRHRRHRALTLPRTPFSHAGKTGRPPPYSAKPPNMRKRPSEE